MLTERCAPWRAQPPSCEPRSSQTSPRKASIGRIPANSGQVTTRYLLNRYGDRNLNNALHTVVQSRIQYPQATRDYVARRTTEAKTSREIKRCLVRYVARDLYRLLENGATAA